MRYLLRTIQMNRLPGYYHTIDYHNLRKTCCTLSVNILYKKLLPYTVLAKQSFTTNFIWYKINWKHDTITIFHHNHLHNCLCLGLHCLSATYRRQHSKRNHTQQNQTLWDNSSIWVLSMYDTMDHLDFLFVCTTRTVLGIFCAILEHTIYTANIQYYRQIIINHIQTFRKNT